MKHGFYARLAWTGIQKNRKTYLPYLLTCVGMVMMYYLISFLSKNANVALIRGGTTLQSILSFGTGVIAVFALIFLFYTNSFLIRRRKKEFGLYNILGMGKGNLTRILLWESAAICAIALLGGLFLGILFSKLAELLLINLMGGTVTFTFSVEPSAITSTFVLFIGIFALIFLNTFRQIHVAKPIELLHSETVGERPPKANWVLALLGVVILVVAYYLAITIQDPISALLWFFVAAVMVIVASYLLFIAGSVVLCKILQKNKGYYYKTRHFVSVSSMMYRMKRNGAGLASICILSTMVLVMLSSTVCLFVGTEDSLHGRYPRDISVQTNTLEESQTNQVHQAAEAVLKKHQLQQENFLQYRCLSLTAILENDKVDFNRGLLDSSALKNTNLIRQVFVLPVDEYNRLTGSNEALAADEVLLCSTKTDYTGNTITLQNQSTKKIKKIIPKFLENGTDSAQIFSSLFLIVPDFEQEREAFRSWAKTYSEYEISAETDYYGFDLSCDDSEEIAIRKEISQAIQKLQQEDPKFATVSVESLANNRSEFYGLNGGLLFLGVLLGIVFVFAAVLIMYYKQISEGYEDQSRFEIMQKVGMTKREIKKSINSQVLTVFFLPLIAAGVHVAFAFPMISKLLLLFGLYNTMLLVVVSLICYLTFALFYVLVYLITSRAYYDIVSGAK
ncbi:FtsX-like permease family protein [Faecalispora anaeroviscerum]|uniref:FtsX-like permease family protein n=1 Tax=Faecalispora anaeroviscerum TaxID=2991836 RepID=UPI0024B9D772|nr:FtsX-like permease family protein [Faecalispora anaeroviscerum]